MWEQIQANRRRSAVLIIGMAVILLLIGFAGGELIAPNAGTLGLLFALLLWGGMMVAYFTSAESILMAGAYARELKKEDSPQLFNIVDEMRLASGLGFMPRIFLIDDPAPNAFAVGRKPKTSSITVTTGLMYRLNRDELQGVIAHEMGHLKNRDVQFMTLAAVMLGSIVILSEIVRRSLWFGGRGRSRSDSRGGKDGDQRNCSTSPAPANASISPTPAARSSPVTPRASRPPWKKSLRRTYRSASPAKPPRRCSL
jgi:heat shock protein HtpX